MKKLCDRCGGELPLTQTGGAMLCRICSVEIQPYVSRLRKLGRPVNILHIARKHFKEHHSAGPYMLRDIPEALSKKLKLCAVKEGCTQRDIILNALAAYLN